MRVVAARTSEQTLANTRQTEVAAGLPALREAEARAAAALQRLIIARETLEREEARAKERIAELDRRLEQFAADLARERKLAADAEAALHRLDREETALTAEAHASAERLTGVNARVAQADAALSASEKSFAELTGALADLAARRNQLQAALADHEQRSARLQAELANIEAGLIATGSGEPDLVTLGAALATAQAALAAAEAAARGAEVAHTQARTEIDAAREPLATAERGVQRLETEAKTIGKLFAVQSKHLWPPVADALVVDNGFEKALGAVLGDDLDAPLDNSAPMHWAGATSIRPIQSFPTASPRSHNMSRRRRNWPAAWRRSVSSTAPPERSLRNCSSPASGWYRAKATIGAGTALPPRHMRRPAQRAGSPNAAGCRPSKASSKPPGPTSRRNAKPSNAPRPRSPPPPKPRCRRASTGAMRSA